MPHLFVDNLTVIDCSVLDSKRGLIGASWIVDIELTGALDKQSMVFDFAHVKKRIKHIIDEQVDHKLLIPSQYKKLHTTLDSKVSEVRFTTENGALIEHISPEQSLCMIDAEHITHAAVIDYLINCISPELPDNVESLIINLRQEDDYAFYYCYSHGLKKHDGNCQRIAHGHRSRIEIWENGKRSRTWEQYWADTFTDIYIGTHEDISQQHDGRIRFAYTAPQGDFEIGLDINVVHIIPYDSTVECIAQYLAEQIKQHHPESHFKVKAFEGVKKGAIAVS